MPGAAVETAAGIALGTVSGYTNAGSVSTYYIEEQFVDDWLIMGSLQASYPTLQDAIDNEDPIIAIAPRSWKLVDTSDPELVIGRLGRGFVGVIGTSEAV